MFKQRFWTALVLIPLVLFAILRADPWGLGVFTGAFILASGWEWLRLIPIKSLLIQGVFLTLLCLASWLCLYLMPLWLMVGLVIWGGIAFAVLTYPRSVVVWGYAWFVGALCLLLLPLVSSVLVAIYHQPQGKALIIYLFGLVWATDIGAYLIGKKWGRHRLIPHVSPGKTIEGVFGGVLLALLVARVGWVWFSPVSMLTWYGLAIGTVFISILGDLFFSMLKRRCQVKDTGALFPGHGGVLDRLDSFIAAAPLFYAGLCVWPLRG